MADTPKYDKKIIASDKIIAKGIDFFGFLTSSPVVAMQSNPTKPKKQVAAPFNVPFNPNGKNPPSPTETSSFSGFANQLSISATNMIQCTIK